MGRYRTLSAADEDPPPDPPNAAVSVNTGGSAAAASCFIATAAYDSAIHPHVEVLRKFRDVYLLTCDTGKRFVDFYYRHGPKWAQVIAKHPSLKFFTRAALLPLIGYGAFMVYSGLALKLAVMAALMFLAGGLIWRGVSRRSV
jgi:hypothetical protein